MFSNNVNLTVVIKSKDRSHDAREYVSPMDKQTYVEGREGSRFALRLRNGNSFRVLAILSVDGLSVLDGKPAGKASPGYILEPYETLDVPGWVVDNGTAAKFFFSGLRSDGTDESYVAQSGGDTNNRGFIGLQVFREKHQFINNHTMGGALRSRGIAPSFGASLSTSGGAAFTTSSIASNSVMSKGFSSATFNDSTLSDSTFNDTMAVGAPASLGTGFGEATNFKTQKASFNRGDLLTMMVIKYADDRELKRRGIDVSRPAPTAGSAFPADEVGGCSPPAGWNR